MQCDAMCRTHLPSKKKVHVYAWLIQQTVLCELLINCWSDLIVMARTWWGQGGVCLVTKCGSQCLGPGMWPRVQPPPPVSPVNTVRGIRPQTRPLERTRYFITGTFGEHIKMQQKVFMRQ